jgi:hypothetical protein
MSKYSPQHPILKHAQSMFLPRCEQPVTGVCSHSFDLPGSTERSCILSLRVDCLLLENGDVEIMTRGGGGDISSTKMI